MICWIKQHNINNFAKIFYKMKKFFLLVFTIILLSYSNCLFAQYDDKRWAISLHLGNTISQGTGDAGNFGLAGGASVKYSLANNFSVRFQGFAGQMNTNKYYYNSQTTFYEGNAQALLNIVNFKNMKTGRNSAQLYVGLGVGYSVGDIKYSSNGTIFSPGTNSSTSTIIVPMCAGMRFYVTPLIDLGFEYTTRSTFVNNFDGGPSPSAPVTTTTTGKFYDFYTIPNIFVTFNIGRDKTARNL